MKTALVCNWQKGGALRATARGLRSLGWKVECMKRRDERDAIIERICTGDIGMVVAMQRFYKNEQGIMEAARETGTRTLFMDFGFTHHYRSVVLDAEGENATSRLRREIPTMPLLDYGIKPIPIPERGVAPSVIRCVGDEPFVFMPLQRPKDMVIRLDSKVNDFAKFIRHVCNLSPYRVIVKPHPHDRNMPLPEPDNCHIIRTGFSKRNEQINNWLLAQAAIVVGVNSNMLWRAVQYDKPVIAAGRGWYSDANVLCEYDGHEAIDCIEPPATDWLLRQRYIHACLSRQLLIADLDKPDKLGPMLESINV